MLKKIALVTGATGAIGPLLIQRLLDQGWRVRAFVRSPASLAISNDWVEPFQGDIVDSVALKAAMKGVDVVFHLAAKLHAYDHDGMLREEFQRVNVEGTRNVIAAARAAGIRRVVFCSTISVYGPSRAEAVHCESSAPHPATAYERTKCLAEKIALAATRKDSRQPLAVVLRLAAVYGSRMKGNYPRMAKAMQNGWFIPVGAGANRRTLIYEEDAAEALLMAARHPDAAGQIFNVTDGCVYLLKDIEGAIYRLLGKQPPKYRLPVAPLRFIVDILDLIDHMTSIRFPLKRVHIDKLVEDMAVSGEKAGRELGFAPRYTLADGWRKTLLKLNMIE